jgi:hypothetical protein
MAEGVMRVMDPTGGDGGNGSGISGGGYGAGGAGSRGGPSSKGSFVNRATRYIGGAPKLGQRLNPPPKF